MSQDQINRYQPGGDLYTLLTNRYGSTLANSIAAAAATGDQTKLDYAFSALNVPGSTEPLDTSTLDALAHQLATDPLGAPLEDLNGVLGNTFLSFLKNPMVLIAGAVVLFIALGGFGFLARKLAKK